MGAGPPVNAARNILVAFNGSPQAQRALDIAIGLAVASHGRLTILTAAPRVPYLACFGASAAGVTALKRSIEAEAERALCQAAERVPENVSVTKIFTRDPICRALVATIEDGSHDLVVLGSRGLGRIRAALFGSVSRYALRHSPVPVLVVHASPSMSVANRLDEAADVVSTEPPAALAQAAGFRRLKPEA
jgi:nucleotide-binding universal stress UspA family protein